MKFDPGQMHHKVTILVPGAGGNKDVLGTEVPGYRVLCSNCWAEVRDLKPQEVWQAMMAQARITKVVTIYYRPGVVARSKVLHRGQIMNLVGLPADPDQKHELLILQCVEPGTEPAR